MECVLKDYYDDNLSNINACRNYEKQFNLAIKY